MKDMNQNEDKRKFLSELKKSFSSRKFKGGAYATVISTVVIVVMLLVNIIVTELDLKIDVSSDSMYTLTEETKEYVKSIKDDITIYYMAQTGAEDETFTEIIEKYGDISGNITVEYKDPVMYPKFASQYTEETVNEDSIIVVNNTNQRAKYVDNSEMYEYEMDYNTYQSYVSAIDVEGQVTSALQYVTTDDLPVMYMVEGHGEAEISDVLASSIAKVNVATNTLTTLTIEEIPDDCSILFINAPQTDYSEDEVNIIKTYLAAGGDAIVLVDYGVEGLTNFNSLMNYYGVEFVEGIVLEGSTGYYMGQYVNNLVPSLESHTITSPIKSNKTSVVVPAAKGIGVLDSKRSTIEIEPLLVTSEAAYSKIDMNSTTIEPEDGDITGPFNLGVAITETYSDVDTKLVVYGSAYIIEESMLNYSALGNMNLFINSVNYIADREDSVAIPTRSVVQQYLTLNAAQVNFWGAIVVVIIPVIVLALGGFICLRRRKK